MKVNYKAKAKRTYNAIAEAYHEFRTKKFPFGWFYNELLEMPTTLKLLGNVKGKQVLDLGCGTGIYARLLKKKGANVKGIDISEEMVKIALANNPDIEFKVGDAEHLPYKDEQFDVVLAALTLEYFPKWDKVFQEVRRVLKPNGLFVFSIGNPVVNAVKKISYKGRRFRVIKDYFKEGLRKSAWPVLLKPGRKKVFWMYWHHKTYSTIIKTIVRNGFELIDYEDAYPAAKAKRLFPKLYKKCIDMPYFCSWKLRKK